MPVIINGDTGITTPSVAMPGSTSGTATISPPAVAGTNTVTLPAATGTAVVGSAAVSAIGQIPFSTDGSTYTPTAKIVKTAAVAMVTSPASSIVELTTSIPTWATRVTVTFNSVSTSSTSPVIIQLGSTTYATSGYTGANATGGGTFTGYTTGFLISLGTSDVDAAARSGVFTFYNNTGNTWTGTGFFARDGGTNTCTTGGYIALSGALDRIRVTTVGGLNTFDLGSATVFWE